MPEKSSIRLRRPVSAITAYDYPSARLAEEAGFQVLLVGDSLGMVVAGNPDTTSVTLEHIKYHTSMVARAAKKALVVADFPINTYRDPEEAVESARQLIDAGAGAVKLEGGFGQVEKIRAICSEDICVMGHLGMLPQRVREEGGYKKKGKTDQEADRLVEAALALESAGVFAIVLESVVAPVAKRITKELSVPTIGIGAGAGCDGQIRVLHDVIGAYPWFVPPFATVYGNVATEIKEALAGYKQEIEEAAID